MKLKQIGSNQTEIAINGVGTFLFSYQTCVAGTTPNGVYYTSQYYSRTTTKHIKQWLSNIIGVTKPQAVDQSVLDNLVGGE